MTKILNLTTVIRLILEIYLFKLMCTMYKNVYQNIALMAMSFMSGSALYLILKEYFQYDFN